jgi:hypothetical protein
MRARCSLLCRLRAGPERDDTIKLRHLVAGSLGLSKQETLVRTKEALWRLGRAIETGLEPVWSWAVRPEGLWSGVKALTGHKMSAAQLQQLYRTMKQQGYRSLGELPGRTSLPVAEDGECTYLHTCCGGFQDPVGS